MKRRFQTDIVLEIIGQAPTNNPYLWIGGEDDTYYGSIDGKDLAKLARNILRACGKSGKKQ